MTETGSTPNGRSRRARIAVPFVVGAMAGATVVGGVALVAHDQGSNGGAEALAAATPGTAVAMKAQALSAEQLYRLDSPGVVDIGVTTDASPQGGVAPFGPSGGSARAEGTGFVYDTTGDIVTASHVVDGATAIQVRFKDGSVAKATLVGADASSDTAVIKVNVASSKLKPLGARRQQRRPAGAGRCRDRQSFRLRGEHHRRHRERGRPRHRGAERLLDLEHHPDRRRDQPRQLRRPADRRERQGDRRQRADRR